MSENTKITYEDLLKLRGVLEDQPLSESQVYFNGTQFTEVKLVDGKLQRTFIDPQYWFLPRK